MKNPAHPGGFVKTEIVEPMGLTVTAAAQGLGVTRAALSAVLNQRASLSADMAIRIEKAFGVSMETLMRMQASFDIARAHEREDEIDVQPYGAKNEWATDVLKAIETVNQRLDPRVEEAMRKAGIRTAKTKPARKKAAANNTPEGVYIEARPKGRQGSAIEDYVVEQGDRVLKTFKTQAEAITWAKSKGHSPHVARAQAAKRPAPAKSRA
jgi:antitoxin HigA-1